MISNLLEYKFRFIIGVVCLITFVFGIILISNENKSKNIKYSEISTEEEIHAKILSVEIERSFARVIFNGEGHRTIYFARNRSYEPQDLASFVQKNDSISKNLNNDTIAVIRNNTSYIFVLGKEIQCCSE